MHHPRFPLGTSGQPASARPLARRLHRLAAALSLSLLGASALAQSAATTFDLPAQPLATSLTAVARQAGVQVLFASDDTRTLQAPALQGQYTPQAALAQLLADSGLRLEARADGAYAIVAGTAAPHADASANANATPASISTLAPVAVVASRAPRAIDEVPNTVWVIEREAIEEQARAGVPLKEMLGMLIPGMDLGGQMRTNFGQNLRGRPAQVMIDGVSLNGSRLLSRQFDAINPFNIERIEVLSGATAIYGGNATGGIINIVTLRGAPGPAQFTSEAGVRSGLHSRDDVSGHVAQSIAGGTDTLHGRLAVAWQRNGGSYDGDGQRVLPDITQTDLQWNRSVDVMASADADFGAGGTLRLLAQHYDSGYHPGKALWMQPGPGNNILQPSDLAVRDGFDSDVEPRTRRHLLAADYHLAELPGGQDLYLKAHHRKESLQFYPFPGNDANPLGGARVPYWSTSTQETTTYGARAMLLKNWSRAQLSYGVDYDHERFTARQTLFDMTEAMASGGLRFRDAGTLGRYPSFSTNIWGVYGQLNLSLTDDLSLDAGVRHQRVDIDVDDFVQVAQQRLVAAGYGSSAQAIPGGSNRYSTTLFNAGLLYRLTPAQQLWANYTEGFELADPAKYYGTGATYAPLADANAVWQLTRYLSVDNTQMAAIKTRSAELGWRYADGPWQSQVALFHAQSDQSIAVDRATLNIQLNDAKVRNYGIEAQLGWRHAEGWMLGGNLLLLRTEERTADGWQRRGIYNASPSKVTLHAGRQTRQWGMRVQVAHSLRLKSDVPSFGTGASEQLPSLTLVDVLGHYRWPSNGQYQGTLSFGVQNLFNKTYATRWSEQAKLAYASAIAANVLDFKGQGRTFALTYTLNY